MRGGTKLAVDTGRVLQILEQERVRRRLGVSDWAKELGLERTAYPKLGTTRTLPSTGTLLALATRLGWLVDELLEGVSPKYDEVRRMRLPVLTAALHPALVTSSNQAPPPSDGNSRPYGIIEVHMDEVTRALHSLIDGLTSEERQLAHKALRTYLAERWSAGARAEDSLPRRRHP